MIYCWGEEANHWLNLPEHLRVQRSLDYLKELHGNDIERVFENGWSIVWLQEQYSSGAFLHAQQNQQLLFKKARKPEWEKKKPTIFFAGEHLSNAPSWVHGATTSALLAVMQLHNANLARKPVVKPIPIPLPLDFRPYFPSGSDFIYIFGENGVNQTIYCTPLMQMTWIDLPPNTTSAMHRHWQEQLGYVLEGSIQVTIASESQVLELGETYYVPSNTFHIVRSLAASKSRILEVFSPPKPPCPLAMTDTSSTLSSFGNIQSERSRGSGKGWVISLISPIIALIFIFSSFGFLLYRRRRFSYQPIP